MSHDAATVLLVDDDKAILTTSRMAFEAKGLNVLTARNGKEALTQARNRRPDAIVLDLMMPVMDGREFLRELKRDTSLHNVPVIVCSALLEEIEKDEIMALGAADYVVKTELDLDQLVARVEKFLPKTSLM